MDPAGGDGAVKRGRGRAVRGTRMATPADVGSVPGMSSLRISDHTESDTSAFTETETDFESIKKGPVKSVAMSNFSPDEESTVITSSRGSGDGDDQTTSIPDSEKSDTCSNAGSDGSRMSRSSAQTTRREGFDKRGNYGSPMLLQSNYFEMNQTSNFTLNQYRVDFEPAEDSTKIKKALMRVHVEKMGAMIFDGHMMYRTDLLPEDLEHLVSVTDSGVSYKLHIRLVGHVAPTDPMFLQFYNIVMRNCLTLLGMEELGRNFYDRKQRVCLEEDGLELWPGYVTAIRNHEMGTLLCVEVTHKVLRTTSVLSYIKETVNRFSMDRARDIVKKDLIGQIVMTHYNQNTYRIDDIDFDSSPAAVLGKDDPALRSYADYYKEKYNIVLTGKELDQPMLISQPKKKDINKGFTKPIYLVPSLCNLTGLTDEMRKNFQLMRRLSTHLHMNPTARKRKLDDFMGRLRDTVSVQNEFKRWDIDFSPKYISVQARNLGLEDIYLADGRHVIPDLMGDWTQGLRNAHLYVSKPLMNWIVYAPENEQGNIQTFLQGVRRQAEILGMRIEKPLETIYYDGRRDVEEAVLARPLQNRRGAISFVFFVLPNNQLRRYAAVKKFFVLKHAIPIQCFLCKNIQNKSFNSICSKLMIQVNSKIGGEPWHLKNPIKEVMVLGFDVYHCAERANESVGALVSTINNNLTRYFSTVSFHKDKSELSSNMCLDTKKSLDAYFASNQTLPAKIILFRDGVGEGQIPFVLNHEVDHMRAAINEKYAEKGLPLPNFAFVIVTKKINSRVIAAARSGGDFTNPPPGTVVDDVITLPERYDFFLVSQSVRQGTVSPTNYNVVYDASGLTADRMQRFTYKMCHLYFNWSGTVAVPAPCQYAHKLAYLTGVALGQQAPSRLADLLWYL